MEGSAGTSGGRLRAAPRPLADSPLSLRQGLALTLLVNGLLAAWVVLRPVRGPAFVDGDDLLQTLGGILAAVFCFLIPAGGRRRPAVLCGLGIAGYAAGQTYLTGYQMLRGGMAPSPSLADVFDLLAYPLMLAGLLCLPARPLARATRGRIALDGLMILCAAVTFSWRFVLGPFWLQSHQALAAKVVNVGYPLGDLILLFCLLLIAARSGSPRIGGGGDVALLAFGLLLVMATDTVETYQVLHGGYAPGTLLDVGWSLGYVPAGLAVASLCRRVPDAAGEAEAGADRPPPLWLALLPYALLPAVGLLVAATRRLPGPPALNHGVWLGALALVGLVLARQVLSILENAQLYGSLQGAYAALAAGEARYRQTFEANPHPTWVYAVETLQILAVNEAAVQSYGYSREEFLARTMLDVRPPEEHDALRARLAHVHAHPAERHERVSRHHTRDGRVLDVVVTSCALDFGGGAARMVTAQDVTESHRIAAERERLLREAEAQADRDPLTGLWNHRAFHRRLHEEADRAQREGTSLAVVMLDLDNFKFFNDSYGHAAGDEVLRHVAGALGGACRSYDTLARFGGDEFALLLPVGEAGADETQARLSERLGGLTFRPPGHDCAVPLAVSFGVALFPQEAASPGDALLLADERLYRAKGGGAEDAEAERLRRELLSSIDGYSMLDALLIAVDNKDRYTRRHSEDVLSYSVEIARALGMDEAAQRAVAVAALLHDVGKIGVPNAVLRKPGRLTPEEFEAVQKHPMMGAVIVGAVPGFEGTLDAIRHHHERWDGEGYPFGLRGEETPPTARLMAVADAYSAMTTDRPYRAGMGEDRALAILEEGAGTQWDPACVRAFLRARRGEITPQPPILWEPERQKARAA